MSKELVTQKSSALYVLLHGKANEDWLLAVCQVLENFAETLEFLGEQKALLHLTYDANAHGGAYVDALHVLSW